VGRVQSRWGLCDETAKPSDSYVLRPTVSGQCFLLGSLSAESCGCPTRQDSGDRGVSTGTPDEKKKGRSKNKQPKNQITPAVRQIHVVLWDEPPKGNPQEDDTDLEPDPVRANPIGSASSQRRHR
jgi:hypothetical protein